MQVAALGCLSPLCLLCTPWHSGCQCHGTANSLLRLIPSYWNILNLKKNSLPSSPASLHRSQRRRSPWASLGLCTGTRPWQNQTSLMAAQVGQVLLRDENISVISESAPRGFFSFASIPNILLFLWCGCYFCWARVSTLLFELVQSLSREGLVMGQNWTWNREV